jgi:hypothetical protein
MPVQALPGQRGHCQPRLRGLQVPGGQVDAMLAECRWCRPAHRPAGSPVPPGTMAAAGLSSRPTPVGQDRAAPPGAPLVPLAVCDYLNVAREQHLKPGRECRCLATFTSSCTQGNSSTRYSFEGNVQMRTDDKSPLEGRTAGARGREPACSGGPRPIATCQDHSPCKRLSTRLRPAVRDSGNSMACKRPVQSPKLDRQAWHARGHVS